MKNQVLQFSDMPAGTHFQDMGKNPRKFIKLHQAFGGGDPFKVYRVVLAENDEPKVLNGQEMNAIDYDGYGAFCPDHVEFKIISIL